MIRKFPLILFIFVLLSACSSNKPAEPSQPLTVEFQVDPKPVKAGEVTIVQVLVKQGEDLVEDAQQVEFEIWEKGQEKHDMVPAENKGKGIYAIQERFHKPTTYYVMYHVTARDFHSMKQMEVVVEGESAEHTPAPSDETTPNHQHQEVDHHHQGTMIHFMTSNPPVANQPVELTAHIQQHDDQPLTGAKVRFEYWTGQEEKHQFIDAAEKSPGEYTVQSTFPKTGEYKVITHVEKGDDIHDHVESTLIVK